MLRPRRYRRAAGCLLLLLVTYNVTAELAHSHGRLLPTRSLVAASFGGASTGDAPAKLASSGGGVCLLCQFQQQLAHGLLHTPPFAFRPQIPTIACASPLRRHLPAAKAPPRGRAPPSISPA